MPSRHKLQWNGLQLENVLVGHIRAVPSYACTGTKLGLTSKDDSWVGEGNGIDGQTSIGLQGSVPHVEADFVGMKQYSTQWVVSHSNDETGYFRKIKNCVALFLSPLPANAFFLATVG